MLITLFITVGVFAQAPALLTSNHASVAPQSHKNPDADLQEQMDALKHVRRELLPDRKFDKFQYPKYPIDPRYFLIKQNQEEKFASRWHCPHTLLYKTSNATAEEFVEAMASDTGSSKLILDYAPYDQLMGAGSDKTEQVFEEGKKLADETKKVTIIHVKNLESVGDKKRNCSSFWSRVSRHDQDSRLFFICSTNAHLREFHGDMLDRFANTFHIVNDKLIPWHVEHAAEKRTAYIQQCAIEVAFLSTLVLLFYKLGVFSKIKNGGKKMYNQAKNMYSRYIYKQQGQAKKKQLAGESHVSS